MRRIDDIHGMIGEACQAVHHLQIQHLPSIGGSRARDFKTHSVVTRALKLTCAISPRSAEIQQTIAGGKLVDQSQMFRHVSIYVAKVVSDVIRKLSRRG